MAPPPPLSLTPLPSQLAFCVSFPGTLLVSGIVTLYTTYLCWSALAERPDTTCNPFPPAGCSSWGMIFGGLVMTLCILFSANSASSAELKMDSVIHGDPQGTSATSDLEKPLDDSAVRPNPPHDVRVGVGGWGESAN